MQCTDRASRKECLRSQAGYRCFNNLVATNRKFIVSGIYLVLFCFFSRESFIMKIVFWKTINENPKWVHLCDRPQIRVRVRHKYIKLMDRQFCFTNFQFCLKISQNPHCISLSKFKLSKMFRSALFMGIHIFCTIMMMSDRINLKLNCDFFSKFVPTPFWRCVKKQKENKTSKDKKIQHLENWIFSSKYLIKVQVRI